MQDSSPSTEFNTDIEFIERIMDNRSKLGIHWFCATSSMIGSKDKLLEAVTPKTQVLMITDMANNRFFPLVMFERPDMKLLKQKFLSNRFNDAEDFIPLAFNTLSAIEGFCEGVMRCATVILTKHTNEFDPEKDFDQAWKKAIDTAVNEITEEVRKELKILDDYAGISIQEWKFKIIPHKLTLEEKLDTGADYSMRALRKTYQPR